MDRKSAVEALAQILAHEVVLRDRHASKLQLSDDELVQDYAGLRAPWLTTPEACRANAEACVRTAVANVTALEMAITCLEGR